MGEELIDEGRGRAILVLHGGMGDATSWSRVTDRLRDRFRTVRLTRRQYRPDVPRKVTMADEVAQVREVAAALDHPVLVGHSSGAVLALEALVADPGLYSGAVLYEPPIVLDEPLGGAKLEPARAAIAAGKPGQALRIFLRDVVRTGPVLAAVAGLVLTAKPEWAARVERQLDDNDAIDALGNRLSAYAKIDLPVLLVGGDKSPAHLRKRLDALRRALPQASRLTMHGQGHNAERTAPARLAEAVAKFTS
ncbi:alpha/beta hydrolase [Actinoplanes sp. KI2]|uniref:alpha/beta fold hydrolase n=1 Tax=Actinoplanes sp. KI2 TaxID=2983315 RepID=UPI0021D5FAD1|nr:alpha/beta hydrolase [Actinoplanes sp. KI2]MCU7724655.1 alpha/beta hydrolase [Actinoplanes sp. KI2]